MIVPQADVEDVQVESPTTDEEIPQHLKEKATVYIDPDALSVSLNLRPHYHQPFANQGIGDWQVQQE
jgi:hypothetical protein